MNEVFENFEWKNYPNEDTPLSEGNLNKINDALSKIDTRVVMHDNTKASKEEVLPLIKEISFNEENGIFTITRKNGSKFTIDTKLEKIAVNFTYNPTTQQVILTLIDGTKQYIDLSALITEYEFLDTDTISFFVDGSGKVSAGVKEGSIEEKHLRPNYLAEIKVEAVKAEKSAAKSESFAHGRTGTRPGEDTDNAEYYSEKSKEYANSWKGSLLPQGAITFSQLPTTGNVAGHLYNITSAFTSDGRFKDGAGYSYPAGTNIYWTQDGKWDCLSGILTKEVTQAEYDALSTAEKLNGTIYYISDADNSMPVDSALSTTSINPVQNRVITQALNQEIDRAIAAEAQGKIYTDVKIADLINGAPSTLDTLGEIADAMENNQNVVEALNAAIGNKVDKIDGKGLSTNDFTDEFKDAIGKVKWETVTNWDDATETGFYKLGSNQFGIVRGGDKNVNNTNFLQAIFHPEFIGIRGGFSYGGIVNWSIEHAIKENVQSDWDVTSVASDAYIKNKPTIPPTLKSGEQIIIDSNDKVQLNKNGKTIYDWNDAIDNGFYQSVHSDQQGYNVLNRPDNNIAHFGIVITTATTRYKIIQYVWALNSDNTVTMYERSCSNPTGETGWCAWTRYIEPKGGEGKYIQSISETDGKISAVEATMPTYSAGSQLSLSDYEFNLKSVCTVVTDWNNVKTNGWYMGDAIANAPDTKSFMYGIVIAHGNNFVRQIVFSFGGDRDTVDKSLKYERVCNNGTWSNWIETTPTQYIKKSGDTVDGEVAFLGGTNVVRRFGESGVNGFVKVATIKVLNRYINHTIEFDIAGRGRKSATRLYILFDNINGYDPNVYSFLKEGDCTYPIYLSKSDTATWDLLVQKNEPYGSITIFNFHNAGVQGSIEVTYPSNTLLTSVPDNSISATAIEYVPLNSKTKAGIVPAGNNQKNKVYAIDTDGNPKWKTHERFKYNDILSITENIGGYSSYAVVDIYNNVKKITGHLEILAMTEENGWSHKFLFNNEFIEKVLPYISDGQVYLCNVSIFNLDVLNYVSGNISAIIMIEDSEGPSLYIRGDTKIIPGTLIAVDFNICK